MGGRWKQGFPELRKTFFVHNKIFEHLEPDLFKHFESFSIIPNIYAMKWYLKLFVDSFPMDVLLRLWDIFLYEGFDILYTISLTLLKQYKGKNKTGKMEVWDSFFSFVV